MQDHHGRIIPKRHRRMSNRAESATGMKCSSCGVNYTVNYAGVCEWCLRPVTPKRKRDTSAVMPAKPVLCCRCDVTPVNGEGMACSACVREIDDLKRQIREGILIVH